MVSYFEKDVTNKEVDTWNADAAKAEEEERAEENGAKEGVYKDTSPGRQGLSGSGQKRLSSGSASGGKGGGVKASRTSFNGRSPAKVKGIESDDEMDEASEEKDVEEEDEDVPDYSLFTSQHADDAAEWGSLIGQGRQSQDQGGGEVVMSGGKIRNSYAKSRASGGLLSPKGDRRESGDKVPTGDRRRSSSISATAVSSNFHKKRKSVSSADKDKEKGTEKGTEKKKDLSGIGQKRLSSSSAGGKGGEKENEKEKAKTSGKGRKRAAEKVPQAEEEGEGKEEVSSSRDAKNKLALRSRPANIMDNTTSSRPQPQVAGSKPAKDKSDSKSVANSKDTGEKRTGSKRIKVVVEEEKEEEEEEEEAPVQVSSKAFTTKTKGGSKGVTVQKQQQQKDMQREEPVPSRRTRPIRV